MPHEDACQPEVITALEKDGWIITGHQVHIESVEIYVYIDLEALKADRTTFALLSKAAFSLASVADGNRVARKFFGLWRSQGGEVGDLLCDLMFPQEEILRSLKVSKY